MTKIPPDDVLDSLYKLGMRESDQLKTALELYDMEIHQKMSMPYNQKLKTMVKRSVDQKLRWRNFDARYEWSETWAVVTNRSGQRGVERGQRGCHQWKAKGQCSRGDECSFHDEDLRARQTPKTAPPSEPPSQRGRSASRKKHLKGRSTSGKFARQTCRDYLKGNHLVIIGILPNFNSINLNRDANSVVDARLHTGRLKVNPAKKSKEDGDKSAAGFFLKDPRQLGCVFQGHRAAWVFTDLMEEHKSLGIDSTSAIHKSYAAWCKHQKTKDRRSEKCKWKFLITAIRTL